MLEATGKDGWGAFFLWIFWLCGMGMISTTCGHYVPSSDGSGIPRMRALFAGVFQNPMDILSFRTFVAKSFGTVVSSASGLSVGRAGPYSHICTIIGYLLGKLSLFRRVYFGPENYNYLRAGKT
jgi:H+/Cl- antiporter ClcA